MAKCQEWPLDLASPRVSQRQPWRRAAKQRYRLLPEPLSGTRISRDLRAPPPKEHEPRHIYEHQERQYRRYDPRLALAYPRGYRFLEGSPFLSFRIGWVRHAQRRLRETWQGWKHQGSQNCQAQRPEQEDHCKHFIAHP